VNQDNRKNRPYYTTAQLPPLLHASEAGHVYSRVDPCGQYRSNKETRVHAIWHTEVEMLE
jgi:hypothetical protein